MPYDVEAFLSSKNKKAWERVGEAVVIRRSQLDMPQAQLAQEAQLAIQTVSRLEKGHNDRIRRSTAYVVEQVLGWELGSIERLVFDNEEPRLTAEGEEFLPHSHKVRELEVRMTSAENDISEVKEQLNDLLDALKRIN